MNKSFKKRYSRLPTIADDDGSLFDVFDENCIKGLLLPVGDRDQHHLFGIQSFAHAKDPHSVNIPAPMVLPFADLSLI